MSRIRPMRLSRRETLLIKADCADVLMRAADEVDQEAYAGRFDLSTGHGAAVAIVAAFRDTAPGYFRRSRLRRKGAR
jgi:hypothetical protein